MAGCGRNVLTLRRTFPTSNLEIVDSSEKMIQYATESFVVSSSETRISRVQDYPCSKRAGATGLVLAWWCLCYLSERDIDQFLAGAKTALKRGGFLIFAEPLSRFVEENRYKGQSMALRPKSYYDRLFMVHGLKILYMQSYDIYYTDCGAEMAEEVVYVLQTRGSNYGRKNRIDKDIEESDA